MKQRAGRGRLSVLALAGLFVAACGGGGQQQQQAETGPADLSIICRCVQGGTNSNNVTWLLNSVIPGFTKARKEKGQTVNVKLVQFGGSDEELKARLALDLRSHTGEDVINMDGFWIPEFASANLLKPLDQVGGSDVSGWDGWKAIPGNVQSLLQYNQKQYGVPAGTDARVICSERISSRRPACRLTGSRRAGATSTPPLTP